MVLRIAGVPPGVLGGQAGLAPEADIGPVEEVRDRRRRLLPESGRQEVVHDGQRKLDPLQLRRSVQVELEGVGNHPELGVHWQAVRVVLHDRGTGEHREPELLERPDLGLDCRVVGLGETAEAARPTGALEGGEQERQDDHEQSPPGHDHPPQADNGGRIPAGRLHPSVGSVLDASLARRQTESRQLGIGETPERPSPQVAPWVGTHLPERVVRQVLHGSVGEELLDDWVLPSVCQRLLHRLSFPGAGPAERKVDSDHRHDGDQDEGQPEQHTDCPDRLPAGGAGPVDLKGRLPDLVAECLRPVPDQWQPADVLERDPGDVQRVCGFDEAVADLGQLPHLETGDGPDAEPQHHPEHHDDGKQTASARGQGERAHGPTDVPLRKMENAR